VDLQRSVTFPPLAPSLPLSKIEPLNVQRLETATARVQVQQPGYGAQGSY